MGFYQRYADICKERGFDPCAQRTADMFGATKGTISVWKKNNSTPKGETVALIADALGVSSDYLLGRTDDPTDYTNPELIAEQRQDVLDEFDGDVQKAVAFQQAVDEDAAKDRRPHKAVTETTPPIMRLINQLDEIDTIRIEAYVQGLLAAEKYAVKEKQA